MLNVFTPCKCLLCIMKCVCILLLLPLLKSKEVVVCFFAPPNSFLYPALLGPLGLRKSNFVLRLCIAMLPDLVFVYCI